LSRLERRARICDNPATPGEALSILVEGKPRAPQLAAIAAHRNAGIALLERLAASRLKEALKKRRSS
jgi:hypothetical protein